MTTENAGCKTGGQRTGADGWEREGEDVEFFHRFSIDAYAVGFDVLIYAMSH